MSLVELKRFGHRIDAEIARTLLQSQDVHAVLFDADSLGYADGWPLEIRLMVLEEDVDEAAALLAADR